MTVAANAGYPARAAGLAPAEIAARTREALDAVELGALAGRKPHELSGGQQQRVALARCLVARPAVVLMDEPLANLDQHLRERMLQEFGAFHARSGATILYITHDQAEAMSLADRVAVMLDGRIAQVDAPEALYDEPASLDVARFIGRSAVLEGVACGPARVAALGLEVDVRSARPLATGEPVALVVRPETVRLGHEGAPARVTSAAYLGGRFLVEVVADGATVACYAPMRLPPGAHVHLTIDRVWAVPLAGAAQRGSLHGRAPAGKRPAMA
jgi:iron(III) transport system ATP-binding protein